MADVQLVSGVDLFVTVLGIRVQLGRLRGGDGSGVGALEQMLTLEKVCVLVAG